ncbi:MAG: hypothetical protein E7122_05450 [Bacteroidales bacterium]|nr:hypothetical protein [Bacteroidales bacterium]
MDFNLICSQIQELLIRNERVVLPQTGELVVETTPASFLEDGKTILPPGKKLLFRQGEAEGEFEQWQVELSGRIREELQAEGISQVPGLGIFKDEGEGVISFSVDPDFDFAPDSFSLEAISLEENETVNQVQDVVEGVVIEELKVEQEPKVSQTPRVPEEKLAPAIEKEKKIPHTMEQKRKVQKWVVWSAVIVILLLILVLFVVLFKEDFMELLKRILYTEEELEIMRKWAAQ